MPLWRYSYGCDRRGRPEQARENPAGTDGPAADARSASSWICASSLNIPFGNRRTDTPRNSAGGHAVRDRLRRTPLSCSAAAGGLAAAAGTPDATLAPSSPEQTVPRPCKPVETDVGCDEGRSTVAAALRSSHGRAGAWVHQLAGRGRGRPSPSFMRLSAPGTAPPRGSLQLVDDQLTDDPRGQPGVPPRHLAVAGSGGLTLAILRFLG